MHTLEVFRGVEFATLRILVNGSVLADKSNIASSGILNFAQDGSVDIEYQPQHQLPKIRVDGFLINTWLASAVNTSQGLSLIIDQSFADRYKAKDIEGAINSLPQKEQSAPEMFDKFIGINNLYPETVAEIKSVLGL